jgi:hypothetical protein
MQWHERIGRRLKLRDLHILLAVAQHGSMAKAAELAISQPAVSKAIATWSMRLSPADRTRQGTEVTSYRADQPRNGNIDELKKPQERVLPTPPSVNCALAAGELGRTIAGHHRPILSAMPQGDPDGCAGRGRYDALSRAA